MPLPNLIIAGAQKSGTTTLHDMLGQHPAVFMSTPKELHFFDRYYDRGLDWYASCFTPSSEQVVAGESTPFYMYNANARNRMLHDLPHARLICVLRNPIDRAYSHYWHAREKGPEKAASFEEALEREPRRLERSKDGQPPGFSYVDRGRYLQQLQPLAEGVGRERLRVVLMDDLLSDSATVMRDLCEFLEIDVGPAGSVEVKAANTYGLGEASRQGEARDRPVRERGDLPTGKYPPMSESTRARLRVTFEPLNQQLAEWLGRDLSRWQ